MRSKTVNYSLLLVKLSRFRLINTLASERWQWSSLFGGFVCIFSHGWKQITISNRVQQKIMRFFPLHKFIIFRAISRNSHFVQIKSFRSTEHEFEHFLVDKKKTHHNSLLPRLPLSPISFVKCQNIAVFYSDNALASVSKFKWMDETERVQT